MAVMGSKSSKPLVLLIDAPFPPEEAERVRALSPDIEIVDGLAPESLQRANVIYTTLGALDPEAAPALRWVQCDTAAVNHIRDKPLGRSRVPVANIRGAYSPAVAEFTLGMILMLTRNLHLCHRWQLDGRWPPDSEFPRVRGMNLYGKTLGIAGYGNIGRQLGRIAQSMGMRVLACKRRPEQREDSTFTLPGTGDPRGEIPASWFGLDQLAEMFSQSDVAAVIFPVTPGTRGQIGQRELNALPSHAYLVSVGRGGVVDEAALARNLRDGKLAGAGLDVFANEPLEPESPLWSLPNVIMAPHIASYTREQQHLAVEVLMENLRRDLQGKPLLNLVDFAHGY